MKTTSQYALRDSETDGQGHTTRNGRKQARKPPYHLAMCIDCYPSKGLPKESAMKRKVVSKELFYSVESGQGCGRFKSKAATTAEASNSPDITERAVQQELCRYLWVGCPPGFVQPVAQHRY